MPALDTVAGVAALTWPISNISLMEGVSGTRSLLARVITCVCVCVCVCVFVCVHMHVHVCVCMYCVCMCMCVHVFASRNEDDLPLKKRSEPQEIQFSTLAN